MASKRRNMFYANKKQETTEIGVSADLYYVKDGIVNTYAMAFIVPIPAKVSYIDFTWYSIHQLNYVWTVDYLRGDAMLAPRMNISSSGLVPKTAEAFRVQFPCTGARSAEIAVSLHLNVTGPGHRPAILLFKRNKICLKGNGTLEFPRNMSLAPESSPVGESSVGSSSAYLAAGLASTLVLVIFVLVGYMRKKKTAAQASTHTSYSYGTSGAYLGNPNVFIRLDSVDSGSYATIDTCHVKEAAPPSSAVTVSPYATTYVTSDPLTSQVTHHIYSNPQSTVSYSTSHVSERCRVLEMGRDAVRNGNLVQEGNYGQVFTSSNILGPKLMVKTVSEKASQLQATMLLCEGTRLSSLVHDNILPVLAASAEPPARPIVVYPCPSRGNLKLLLSSCRRGETCTLATQELVAMGVQVASACQFLHLQGVLHRDLATRNCYVDGSVVRVGDSALGRDLFPQDYYRVPAEPGDTSRPLRWMPPEAIAGAPFSQSTDLWMFGVVLWELVTLAETPYSELDEEDIEDHLVQGDRLEQPIACPDQLYGVMQCCWVDEPEERPNFTQLLACLVDFATALGPYV